MSAGGQRSDIPDHRSLRIEVGGADEKNTSLSMFLCDFLQHFFAGEVVR